MPHKFPNSPFPRILPLSPGFQVHVLSLLAGNQPVAVSVGRVFPEISRYLLFVKVGVETSPLQAHVDLSVTRGVRAVLKLGAPGVPGAAIGGAGVLGVLPAGPRQPRQFLFCLVYRLASVCAVLEDRVLCLRGLA